MRIIAGQYKNTKIITETKRIKLDAQKIRPTTEKLRAAIFNILPNFFQAQHNNVVENKKVLDVCCGIGSFGLECLSRGASKVSFIDNQRNHLEIVKLNLDKIKCLNKSKIIFGDIQNLKEADDTYDLIYIDPPYKFLSLNKIFQILTLNQWINNDSIIITERSSKSQLEDKNIALLLLDKRVYGSSIISFYSLNK